MSKENPSSITIEEAVARMVNMDYIPAGLTLLDMTAAFLEEAEVGYENARIDGVSEEKRILLKTRMESCKARHELANLFMENLRQEIKKADTKIAFANDASSQQRLTLESVADWAADRFGIGIPEWEQQMHPADEHMKNVRWENVTIKIWKDFNIGLIIKGLDKKRSHFRTLKLMGDSKNKPNQLGKMLVAFAEIQQFPTERAITASDSTAMSKLKRILCQWTGLKGEPFTRDSNWKPNFTIINDENNASDRIMKRSTSYCENKHHGNHS